MRKSILVMGGNPRSGTTALARLLNAHPEVLMGIERYFTLFAQGQFVPSLFERERFLNIRPGDTHQAGNVREQFDDKDRVVLKYDSAKIIGDKIPPIARGYSQLWDNFEDVSVLYIVRNPMSVCESYEVRLKNKNDNWRRNHNQAISDWNFSVKTTLQQVNAGRPIKVVSYERLFQSKEMMKRVFTSLELDPNLVSDEVFSDVLKRNEELSVKQGARNEKLRFEVFQRAAIGPYRKLLDSHCVLRSPGNSAPTGEKG